MRKSRRFDTFIQPRPAGANALLTQVFSTHSAPTARHKHSERLERRTSDRFQSESVLANTHIANLTATRQAIRIRFARMTVCPSSDVFRSEGPLVSAASANTAVTGTPELIAACVADALGTGGKKWPRLIRSSKVRFGPSSPCRSGSA